MKISRRALIQSAAAGLVAAVRSRSLRAQSAEPYASSVLPAGVRSRFVPNGNGITMHVLEGGFDGANRPLVVLLHGFPELAYSWRKVIPLLAGAGYHVVAPDLRGYGRTSGTDVTFDDDIAPFRTMNEVHDVAGLVSALGVRRVAAIVGHDFGAPIAGWCALTRPDVFRAVVMISSPFPGPPTNISHEDVYDALEKLTPPRRYYQRYYATRAANDNMQHAKQGIHAFLRAYYHMKSADWKSNKPFPLTSWSATELAKLPHYYVMDARKGMAENVAPEMPSADEIRRCRWLSESELRVYSSEYARTGFQGGLQSYRLGATGRYTDARNADELKAFSGRTIDVPSMFVGGTSDWGVYQRPGALENMQHKLCTRLVATHLIDGAGHWVQQEQAGRTADLLISFLKQTAA